MTAACFARSTQKIERVTALRMAWSDVMDATSVADAIAGHAAVIVVLGSKGLRDRTPRPPARGTWWRA